MTRSTVLILAAAMALLWGAPARASGDFGCSADLRLRHNHDTGCDNMAVIGPGNDSRVNLLLLIADARHTPLGGKPGPLDPMFEWDSVRDRILGRDPTSDDGYYDTGQGSRCRSNATGARAFEDVVKAARGLGDAERAELIAARDGMAPSCTGASPGGAAIAALAGRAKSPAEREFALYLQGAVAFYDGDFDGATARFTALGNAGQPWVKETARYMLARIEVNRAQVGAFDEYGFPDHLDTIDPRVLARAEAGLKGYAGAYPKGLYTQSALGLLRRVYWLGGDKAKLEAQFAPLLLMTPAQRGMDDIALADEIDDKLFGGDLGERPKVQVQPGQLNTPMLLAVQDLVRMRTDDSPDESVYKPMGMDELQAQKPAFASNPALFGYLVAVHQFYVEKDPHAVMRTIPDASHQRDFSYLEFSRQMLRGVALEAVKDRNVRGFWLDLFAGAGADYQRPALELALAWHDERTGGLAQVFAPGSPVRTVQLRETLLMFSAGPALLRQQARDASAPQHERELALYVLLYKDLTRGAARDFGTDVAMVPRGAAIAANNYDLQASDHPAIGLFVKPFDTGGYPCPTIREVAQRLAANPVDRPAQLCLGEFLRVNGFDQYPLDQHPPADNLGGAPSLFTGPVFSRLEVYKAVIADPRAAANGKAYALYRAVNCYGPSGNNTCGGTEVEAAVRKGWFQQLKRDYPNTSWAHDQKYYW